MMLVSALMGFLGPFLPEVLKLVNRRADQRHELLMLELQARIAERQHAWRMEEVAAKADIAEMQALRAPQASFGVQLLDAAKSLGLPGWMFVPAFWGFAALDVITGLVRPAITYGVVAFYMLVKYATFQLAGTYTETPWAAVKEVWTADDMAMVTLVLSYWFGQRVARWAFGKR